MSMSDGSFQWVDPFIVSQGGISATEEEKIVQEWREIGFALVDGLLPDELVDAAARELMNEIAGDDSLKSKKDFGGIVFPFAHGSALNAITIHENLISIVSKLLKTDDIRLTQADAWAKFQSEPTTSKFDNRWVSAARTQLSAMHDT